jgi:hypothetical protein
MENFSFTYNNHRYLKLDKYIMKKNDKGKYVNTNVYKDYEDLEQITKINKMVDEFNNITLNETPKNKNKKKKRKAFTTDEKIYLFQRQFNYFCGNYPKSNLSSILGFHCNSYNNPSESFITQRQDFFEIEHLIQFSRGGEDNLSNCYLLCSNCHRVKTKKERNKENLKIMEEEFKLNKDELCNDFRKHFKKNLKEYINENNFHKTHKKEIKRLNDIVCAIEKNGHYVYVHSNTISKYT